MTDERCQSHKQPELRGGRELTVGQVTELVGGGRSWLGDRRTEVPVRVHYCYGGPSCAADRVTQAIVNAWCWMKEAATRSWRRDLHLQVTSLLLGLMNSMTISPHGALSTGRAPVDGGR
jgi:hypothetical protein